MAEKEELQPPQHQDRQPGRQGQMTPKPRSEMRDYRGSGKLKGKKALVTGGDSGIGRAVSIGFAKEGADVAIIYLEEDADANETRRLVQAEGRRCHLIRGDVGDESFCKSAVAEVVQELGEVDILVNNAGEQHPCDTLEEISTEQLHRTYATNIFSMFYVTRAALPHLGRGSAIVNSTSVTAYRGSPHLIDYASTKGAIVSFTRSLALALADRGIRVNGVAPGPIWTPLIPASFDADHVATFGGKVPLGRPGQPDEVAPCYIFLASGDGSYMTGQILHPNGGEIVGG